MESIQTKMLQATQPVKDQSAQIYKSDELQSHVIIDYHTETQKVSQEISDALSNPTGTEKSSPTFGTTLGVGENQSAPIPDNEKKFSDTIDELFKQDLSSGKIDGSFASFETPRKTGE